jgi:NDP-sugar pyrophosphorylase family protein
VEDEPLGTGGAIKLALEHIEGDEFFVLNSDDINNADLGKMMKIGANTVAVSQFHSQFGIVETKGDKITEFRQKPLLPYWANIGLYMLSRKLNYPKNGAIETEILPQLAKKNQLNAFRHTGYWVTINTMKELDEAAEFLKKQK